MANKTLQERVRETIYPNGVGAITAEKEQALLIEFADEIDKKANKADIPDEVYIGETEPTDEKVKVWINPNEEANTIQARTTSGGGTSGSGLYSIKVAEEEDGRDLSEEDKEYNASVCRKILEGTLDAPLIVSLDVLILFVSMIQVESEGVRLTMFVNDVGSITPLTVVMSADGLATIVY